jgi:biotin carboxylase
MPDSEILRLEKRQRGLQRVATAINDLSIYGIYPTNFPKLIQVLEHAKDHIKAEILATKKRMVEKSELIIEEVYTDPLKTETQIESDKINDEYIKKGI